jgi:small subunit ribosomal protein S1
VRRVTGSDKGKGFADLFEASEQPRGGTVRVGSAVEAKVVQIGSSSVFVDLGAKAEGIIDRAELTDDDGALTVAVGDTVRAHVASKSGGTITLRVKLSAGHGAGELEQAYKLGLPVSGTVAAVNKGGVEVEIGPVRAFCPISQLEARYVEDPASYVGQKLEFKVTRFDTERGKPNAVLSRRVLLDEQNAKRSAELRATLEVGSTAARQPARLRAGEASERAARGGPAGDGAGHQAREGRQGPRSHQPFVEGARGRSVPVGDRGPEGRSAAEG